MSIGGSSSKTKTNSTTKSQGETDPWDYSIPYLQDFLTEAGAVGGTGLTPDQKYAYEFLKGNAFEGNPFDQQIAAGAERALTAPSRSGQVGEAYGLLSDQLMPYASGQYLDPFTNPQMRQLLDSVSDDVSSRINQQFAASGRDLSGKNQQSVARGVTQAQLPILFDQFNRQQQNQLNAANALYGAGQGGATTQAQLDAANAGLVQQGSGLADLALTARDLGANQIINLDQQIKHLPYEDLGVLGSILFPVAGLGSQQSGTSNTQGTSSTKGSSFGLKIF